MTAYNSPIVLRRADPWMFKVGGEYWFAASGPEYGKIAIRHAPTINDLQKTPETVIWRKHEFSACSEYIWVPELHHANGAWYIYFAGVEHGFEPNGMPTHHMFVLGSTDTDPTTDNWVEKDQIVTPIDSFSLDATTEVIDGMQYPVWTQKGYDIPGNSNLYVAPMANPWTLTADPVMFTKPKYDWEYIDFLINKGPASLFHDDKIFITYFASGTSMPYVVGLLTADRGSNLIDPRNWAKNPVPVLRICSENDQYSPDRNSFTKSEDGSEDLMIYYMRNCTEIKGDPLFDPNRHAHVNVVHWSEDGTPDFGMPEPDNLWTPVTTSVLPPGSGPKADTPAVGPTAEV